MKQALRIAGIVVLILPTLLGFGSLTVTAEGPPDQGSPANALAVGDAIPAIAAHGAQWLRFEYRFDGYPSPRPRVTVRLLNAVPNKLEFEIWSPERMQPNWQSNPPVGRGAPEAILNCVRILPDNSRIKCTTPDLAWVGGFGAPGTYYIRIVNNSENSVTPTLEVNGNALASPVPTPAPVQVPVPTPITSAASTPAATPVATPTFAATAVSPAATTGATTPPLTGTTVPTVQGLPTGGSSPTGIPGGPSETATAVSPAATAALPAATRGTTSAATLTTAATLAASATATVIPATATRTYTPTPTFTATPTAGTSALGATPVPALSPTGTAIIPTPPGSLTRPVTPTSAPTSAQAATPSGSSSAANRVTVDITINDAGEISIGGVRAQALGLAPLDAQAVQTVKSLGSAHLVIQGQIVTAEVNGTPLLKIQWDPASRQVTADLAARYGYAVSPQVLSRIEEWLASATVDVTARYGNQASKPLMVNLTKPVLVDIGSAGQVTVEKIPLAMVLDPGTVQTIKQGQIRNLVLCWKQGTLTAQVDGRALPQVVFDPQGAQLLNKTLGLNLDQYLDLDPLFADLLGVDVSFSGGAHNARATCGQ